MGLATIKSMPLWRWFVEMIELIGKGGGNVTFIS